MPGQRIIVTLLTALVCAAAAAPALAQATFGQVRAEGSPTVYVTDRTGQETKGQLITLSESEITIKTGALTKTFTADQVSLIERKGDSLKNGAIIGAVFGVLAGVALAGDVCAGTGHHCAGRAIGFTIFSAGLYAAMGAGVDAVIPGRSRIWPSNPNHR